MQFAFGPKILLDPRFGITFKEIQTKFKGTNKISKDATLLLSEREVYFEGLDLKAATMTCKNGVKEESAKTDFIPAGPSDAEIYQIRGYKPS